MQAEQECALCEEISLLHDIVGASLSSLNLKLLQLTHKYTDDELIAGLGRDVDQLSPLIHRIYSAAQLSHACAISLDEFVRAMAPIIAARHHLQIYVLSSKQSAGFFRLPFCLVVASAIERVVAAARCLTHDDAFVAVSLSAVDRFKVAAHIEAKANDGWENPEGSLEDFVFSTAIQKTREEFSPLRVEIRPVNGQNARFSISLEAKDDASSYESVPNRRRG
ncbi:hypothetical protein J2R99_002009 [Rhodopseudomonas julia]|uniref:Signal transduction histidine kinase subgroup 3 dimerisation and phosphoacceptor domain-containing protein n=1 Tax=Rhodopseudomonas julia TaxID=200617 RepID=A0ABU0C6K9_9BRAD|nr:hypothetical protein [Rhodopseudomonas julia]MDQ0326140.1 hypothetical protein [Rhodopseudomonas julia]